MSYPNPDETEYHHEHTHDDGSEPHEHPHNEAEISAQKEIILKQILDSQARMRLNNIKMVKPELATMVENYLIGMASQGKLGSQISDASTKTDPIINSTTKTRLQD